MILSCLLATRLLLALPGAAPAAEGPFLAPRPALAPVPDPPPDLPPDLGYAVDQSLAFLDRPKAGRLYGQRPADPFTLPRMRRTLRRFKDLLARQSQPADLEAALEREFEFHPVAGDDRQGGVQFTGYFEPTYEASRTPSPEYRYPLFRAPANFASWPKPHPTRRDLVGLDGLQAAKGPLKGLELVWLKDRFQAFLVEVQGSARLRLPDGSSMIVGNQGITNYPYVSLARLLAADGKLPPDHLGIPSMTAYFADHPEDLQTYLARCNRMVFFRESQGDRPTGALEVPITELCSVATDRDLFPAGGLLLVEFDLPQPKPDGSFTLQRVRRLVLDQDTGGGIKGPGRIDYYLGSGPEAGAVAGLTRSRGRAWYLLLKEGPGADEEVVLE